MKNIRQRHRDAMTLADRAYIARRNGQISEALQLFADAYVIELEIAQQSKREPSRSILYRSTATLALHAQLYREAEQAVAMGLIGNPPEEVAQELRDVFDEVNFHRHLSLKGMSLSGNELQMSIVGNAISHGMANLDVFVGRVQNLEKMLIRTAQRINGRPLKRSTSSKEYNLFMSPPRAGSFEVTLRVGQPQQELIPELDDRPQVIDELLHNLYLLNERKEEQLKKEIGEPQYYDYFINISREFAPDGDNVKMVGVTALRNNVESSVGFSRTKKEIKKYQDLSEELGTEFSEPELTTMYITGSLYYATARNKNEVRIVDETGKTFKINVTEAIAEDVVRPYFGKRVTIEVIHQLHANKNIFVRISEAT